MNEALAALEKEFSALYSPMGRPSIPPEKLLRAMLLQAFYSIRSERQLMERLEFDLLFRWFVGLAAATRAFSRFGFLYVIGRIFELGALELHFSFKNFTVVFDKPQGVVDVDFRLRPQQQTFVFEPGSSENLPRIVR